MQLAVTAPEGISDATPWKDQYPQREGKMHRNAKISCKKEIQR